MAILRLTSSIDTRDVYTDGTTTNNVHQEYTEEFQYENMTSELFQSYVEKSFTNLKINEILNNENPGEVNSDDIITTRDIVSRNLTSFKMEMEELAKDLRRIYLFDPTIEQDLSTLNSLKEIKLFTLVEEETNFFVEKGFKDVMVLNNTYDDFLSLLSKAVREGDDNLDELKLFYKVDDIQLTGQIRKTFSFFLFDINWQVTSFIEHYDKKRVSTARNML